MQTMKSIGCGIAALAFCFGSVAPDPVAQPGKVVVGHAIVPWPTGQGPVEFWMNQLGKQGNRVTALVRSPKGYLIAFYERGRVGWKYRLVNANAVFTEARAIMQTRHQAIWKKSAKEDDPDGWYGQSMSEEFATAVRDLLTAQAPGYRLLFDGDARGVFVMGRER